MPTAPTEPGTRDRLLAAGAERFGRQGVAATGIKQILADARAPFSSLYHHFPGGKEQLAAEAVLASGRAYGQLIPAFYDADPDPVAATRAAFDGAAANLVASGYEDACPIATVALEVTTASPPLQAVCATVFGEWLDDLTVRFGRFTGPEAARVLAHQVLLALEGAFVCAQALHDPTPLVAARDLVAAAVAAEVGA